MLRRSGRFSLRFAVGLNPAKVEGVDYVRLTLPSGHEVEMTRNEARTLGLMLERLLQVPLQHVEVDGDAVLGS